MFWEGEGQQPSVLGVESRVFSFAVPRLLSCA
jgi:hypothetical protein